MNITTALSPEYAQAASRRMALRVAVVLLLAGCFLLAWWSWHRVQPVNQRLRAATTTYSHLADEAQAIELRWDSVEAGRVEADFKQANEVLFATREEFSDWRAEVDRLTRDRSLECSTRFGEALPRTSGAHRFSVLPATLELRPVGPRSTNAALGPYGRLVAFTHAMKSAGKRVDLVEVTVTGKSNSVEQARVLYHLWAKEEARP